jgi:hypothetical protein
MRYLVVLMRWRAKLEVHLGMDAEMLITEIREAFSGMPKPNDDVVGVDVYTEGNVHLIGPEALRYYFASIVERGIRGRDTDLLGSLVFLLRAVNRNHAAWQVGLFDRRQRDGVRSLLRFLRDNCEEYLGLSWRVYVERAIPLWEKRG